MCRLEFIHTEIRTEQGNERHLPSKQGLAVNSTRSVSSCFVREQLRRPHKVTEESSSASSRHSSLLKIRKQILVIRGKRHAFRTKKAEKSLLLSKEIRSNINGFSWWIGLVRRYDNWPIASHPSLLVLLTVARDFFVMTKGFSWNPAESPNKHTICV